METDAPNMSFKEELTKAMNLLAQESGSIFIGQNIRYPGHIMAGTFTGVPREKLIEVPVFEDTQLGISMGLALAGFSPVVSIFPRLDFLIIACNQLINHLDKIEQSSQGQFKPKVIIRTMVGSIAPMYPGPQHCQDHSEALRLMLTNIDLVKLTKAEEVMPAYRGAVESWRSTILVEAPPKRQGYDG